MKLFFAALITIAVAPPAMAEEVVPTLSRYIFSKQPGSKADECGITLLVSSYPSPEYASARLQAIQGTGGVYAGKSTWGVTIQVSDATYVNGSATTYTPVPLSHATFTGSNFSSDGRLGAGRQADGSIFLYGSSDQTVMALTNAFTLGNVTIAFTRVGSTTVRAYTVAESPPVSVLQQFIACTQKMFVSK